MSAGGTEGSEAGLIEDVDKKILAVRTTSLDFSFNEIADMHADRELIIDPDFQRMFRWAEGAQSRFIESLVLELPVPPIFLLEKDTRVYELIDGLQRISSYLHFRGALEVDGNRLEPLRLADCDIVPELNGLTYEDLPKSLQIKLKRSYIRAEILRKESDNRLRYYMFKRLNTGGEQLSAQEIRNATIKLLSNEFNSFMIDLSLNKDFQYCIASITDHQRSRKADQELVLRFFALEHRGDEYKHDVANFLTDFMEAVSDPQGHYEFDYAKERKTFEKTFLIVRKIAENLSIGSRIFGPPGPSGAPKDQFSVYHYEGLVLGLQSSIQKIDPEDSKQIDTLAKIVSVVKTSPDFKRFTGPGKNDSVPYKNRVQYFSTRFEKAL